MTKRATLRHSFSAAAIWLAATLPASGVPSAAAAVQERPELVDRIVAVVGDTAVLQSELQERVLQLQAQGFDIPNDPEQLNAFLEQVLERKVNDVLLLIHAQREGITVPEAQVEEVVDERLDFIRRRFKSEIEFQQALIAAGFTPAEFRLLTAQQVRAELLTQRYLQQKVSELNPVPVSEEEIRERFEMQRASFGPKPATISLKQIIIAPRPSSDARLRSLERAEQALSRARSGEDFIRLAREYSDDVATRDQGGELGWVRRGQLLPEFETALFDMRAGTISEIVETSVGFHIIKLDRIRGAERFARHILIRPEITDADTATAHRLAEEVASALRAGADPDSLIKLYGDPQERATLTDWPQDRLPPEYRTAIEGAEVGDVIGPFPIAAPGLPGGKWVAAKLQDISPGGEWTLDDLRESLRMQIQQDKMLEQVVRKMRESTYIEIRSIANPVTQ